MAYPDWSKDYKIFTDYLVASGWVASSDAAKAAMNRAVDKVH